MASQENDNVTHTPGPWVMGYDPCTHETALVSASGDVVAVAAWDGGSGCHLEIGNVADQHLIAAAPDLLAALESAEDALAEHCPGLTYLLDDVITPAIAKARWIAA